MIEVGISALYIVLGFPLPHIPWLCLPTYTSFQILSHTLTCCFFVCMCMCALTGESRSGKYETALLVMLPLFPSPFKEIDIPKNLVTEKVTEDSATISWDKVQALIDRYTARCTSADGDSKQVSLGRDESRTTLKGLSPGKEYIIYIWAEKGNQQSKKATTKVVTGNWSEVRFTPHCLLPGWAPDHELSSWLTGTYHQVPFPLQRVILTYILCVFISGVLLLVLSASEASPGRTCHPTPAMGYKFWRLSLSAFQKTLVLKVDPSPSSVQLIILPKDPSSSAKDGYSGQQLTPSYSDFRNSKHTYSAIALSL